MTGMSLTRDAASSGAEPPLQTPPGALCRHSRGVPVNGLRFAPPLLLDSQRPDLAQRTSLSPPTGMCISPHRGHFQGRDVQTYDGLLIRFHSSVALVPSDGVMRTSGTLMEDSRSDLEDSEEGWCSFFLLLRGQKFISSSILDLPECSGRKVSVSGSGCLITAFPAVLYTAYTVFFLLYAAASRHRTLIRAPDRQHGSLAEVHINSENVKCCVCFAAEMQSRSGHVIVLIRQLNLIMCTRTCSPHAQHMSSEIFTQVFLSWTKLNDSTPEETFTSVWR